MNICLFQPEKKYFFSSSTPFRFEKKMVFFFSKPNLKWIKFDFNTTSQVFLFALIKNAAIYNFNTEVWTSFFPSKFVFRKRYIHLHRFDFRRSFTKKKTSTMICIAKNINSFPLAEKWKYDVRCVFVSPKDYYLKLKYSTSRVFFHSSVLSFEGKWKKMFEIKLLIAYDDHSFDAP